MKKTLRLLSITAMLLLLAVSCKKEEEPNNDFPWLCFTAQKAKEQEQKKQETEAKTTQQQTHTVQSTDNLYRIAIKYYGDGSAANIEKIKKANNLTSDSISTGQVLIINP